MYPSIHMLCVSLGKAFSLSWLERFGCNFSCQGDDIIADIFRTKADMEFYLSGAAHNDLIAPFTERKAKQFHSFQFVKMVSGNWERKKERLEDTNGLIQYRSGKLMFSTLSFTPKVCAVSSTNYFSHTVRTYCISSTMSLIHFCLSQWTSRRRRRWRKEDDGLRRRPNRLFSLLRSVCLCLCVCVCVCVSHSLSHLLIPSHPIPSPRCELRPEKEKRRKNERKLRAARPNLAMHPNLPLGALSQILVTGSMI